MLERNGRNGIQFFSATLVVVFIAGCPFAPTPFGSGASGVGGTEISTGAGGDANPNGQVSTTGGQGGDGSSSGSGDSGGSGGSGGGDVVENTDCLPLDPQFGAAGKIYHTFEYEAPTATSKNCYVLFANNENWSKASDLCGALRSGDEPLGAHLAMVSGKDEHGAILQNLIKLRNDNPSIGTDAWSGGKRNYGELLLDDGAFYWDDKNPSTVDEMWSIFPCDQNKPPCDGESNEQLSFWAHDKIDENIFDLQPNGDANACVRYGLGWDVPGLADKECTATMMTLCEWKP